MTKSNHVSQVVAKSPILWGILASAGFYGLVRAGVLSHWLIERYCTSHPVEYITMTMFFVGLAALVLKAVDMVGQYGGLAKPLLSKVSRCGRTVPDCDALLEQLGRRPSTRQNDYLVGRLREAVRHVRRRGSAEQLDDELKYLADLDAARLHSSYALVRVIIWAIPMLGFLGTVIGLTLAIANLEISSLEESSLRVVGGLAVAFDTTALALALSLLLMFAQFLIEKKENALLDEVDRQAATELEGRFEQISASPEGQLVAVRRMAETVVQAADQLVERQADVWQASMDAAGKRWATMAEAAEQKLQTTLAESLQAHARELAAAQQAAVRQSQRHWDQVQQTQVQQTQAMVSLQAELARQADMLGRAVAATGEVVGLEEALNRNLTSLAGAKHFEQTVMSLAATIHLLNARLTDGPAEARALQLEPGKSTPQAA